MIFSTLFTVCFFVPSSSTGKSTSYVFFESIDVVYVAISSPNTPAISKLSLPYGILLFVIFCHFKALYHFKPKAPDAIKTSSVNLMKLDASLPQAKPS